MRTAWGLIPRPMGQFLQALFHPLALKLIVGRLQLRLALRFHVIGLLAIRLHLAHDLVVALDEAVMALGELMILTLQSCRSESLFRCAPSMADIAIPQLPKSKQPLKNKIVVNSYCAVALVAHAHNDPPLPDDPQAKRAKKATLIN